MNMTFPKNPRSRLSSKSFVAILNSVGHAFVQAKGELKKPLAIQKSMLFFRSGRKAEYFFSGAALAGLLITTLALAAALDVFGPPPAGDPSAFTGPSIGLEFAQGFLGTLPPANEGAFEGGPTGTHEDPGVNNAMPAAQQTSFTVPTNGRPSPLFGAQSFTQKMLLFEEFGTEPLASNYPAPFYSYPKPTPGPAPEQDPGHYAKSAPPGAALEAFLAQPGIAPYPAQFSYTLEQNPWKIEIENFLGRTLGKAPAEGRPAGMGWSHQRWNEFYPQVYLKTAQAGARVNGGFRDKKQMHRYEVGEFGPGGLYYNTAGVPGTEGTTRGISIRFHPRMPVQNHKSLWTFDGTLPPKLAMARY